MKRFSLLPAAAVLLAGCSTFAHAATVGTLTCTAEKQQIKVNLSYFAFGAKEVPATTTAAATSLQTLDIHAALSQFGPLFDSANRTISSCELISTLSDGTQADFVFSGISLHTVTAVARTPKTTADMPAMHTDATFQFDKVKVKSAGGTDDGGTDGGWARIPGSGPVNGNTQ